MEKETEQGIEMISAASEALKFRKENPSAEINQIMHQVSKLAKEQRNSKTKIAMISAASKALELAERNPKFTERKVISELMKHLPELIKTIEQNSES
jgi:hypothetical protein